VGTALSVASAAGAGADFFDFRAFFARDFFEPLDFLRANGVSEVEATAYTTEWGAAGTAWPT
jgi:hypothetical protein